MPAPDDNSTHYPPPAGLSDDSGVDDNSQLGSDPNGKGLNDDGELDEYDWEPGDQGPPPWAHRDFGGIWNFHGFGPVWKYWLSLRLQ